MAFAGSENGHPLMDAVVLDRLLCWVHFHLPPRLHLTQKQHIDVMLRLHCPGLINPGLIYTPSEAFEVSPTAQSQPTASWDFLSRNPPLGPKKRPSIFSAKLWSGGKDDRPISVFLWACLGRISHAESVSLCVQSPLSRASTMRTSEEIISESRSTASTRKTSRPTATPASTS